MPIVKDLNLLKEMGCKLHGHTGKEVSYNGYSFIAWYVNDDRFSIQHKGITYYIEYLDGCFFPFVMSP